MQLIDMHGYGSFVVVVSLLLPTLYFTRAVPNWVLRRGSASMRGFGSIMIMASLLLPILYFTRAVPNYVILGIMIGIVLYAIKEIRRRNNQLLIVGIILLVAGIGKFFWDHSGPLFTRNLGAFVFYIAPGVALTILGEIYRRIGIAEAHRASIRDDRNERWNPIGWGG